MSRLSRDDPSSFSEPGNRICHQLLAPVAHRSDDFISNSVFYLENLVTRHVDLFWNIDFDTETINGEVVLHFDIVAKEIERVVSRNLENSLL